MNTWDLSRLELTAHAPRILSSSADARAVALALPAGESLRAHPGHERAWVIVLDGDVEITAPTGERVAAGASGLLANFAPGERHVVRAISDARLLLILTPCPEVSLPASSARTDQTREAEAAETARQRDVTAGSRDLAAEARDRAAGREEEAILATEVSLDSTIRALLAASDGVRGEAAADRAGAASDRERAAADRAQAGADSGQARIDLEQAQLDGLTGVYTRELGHTTLGHEIDRSRRSGQPFVLAFVDVDGLKELNDRAGHAAGDALLQAVVGTLRAGLRSYDPVVRVGGDEFLCGFTNTTLATARHRVEEMRAGVRRGPPGGSITVGLAVLGSGDSLADLIARADADMYAHKEPHVRGGAPGPPSGSAPAAPLAP
jgi:diguanylate cyclase (GGDEF)-like protein